MKGEMAEQMARTRRELDLMPDATREALEVGPRRCCSPRHPTHFEPSCLELNAIL